MISLIHSRSISSGIHHFWLVGQEREHVVVRESDGLGIVFTMLGRNQNYAIGTLVTIKCSSRRIFQNLDVLHILSYHILDGTLHSIHDKKRGAAAGRLYATDIESRILRIVETCSVKAHQTRDRTQYVITDVACATLVDILVGDDADGTRRLLASKGAIGTYIDSLILKCQGVYDVLLRHCWQGGTCEQCQHKYILCFHIRIHFT